MKEISGEWSWNAEIWSKGNAPIDLCWKKLDGRGKKLFVSVNRNVGLSTDHADADLLDSITEDLKEVMTEISKVQQIVYKKTKGTIHRFKYN